MHPSAVGRHNVRGILLATSEIAQLTVVIAALKPVVSVHARAALYVLAPLPLAIWWGTWAALAVAVVSTLVFNYFFIPPPFALTPADADTYAILVISMVTAIVVSRLAGRAWRRAREAEALAQEVRRIAEEQSALRRVATLVARGVPPASTPSPGVARPPAGPEQTVATGQAEAAGATRYRYRAGVPRAPSAGPAQGEASSCREDDASRRRPDALRRTEHRQRPPRPGCRRGDAGHKEDHVENEVTESPGRSSRGGSATRPYSFSATFLPIRRTRRRSRFTPRST